MMRGVGVGIDSLQRATPIVSGFLLGYVAVLPLVGRLADLADRWDGGSDLRAEYAAGCSTIGRRVRVHLDEQAAERASVVGQAVGVGENGELLVAFGDKVEAFAAGDVVHLR